MALRLSINVDGDEVRREEVRLSKAGEVSLRFKQQAIELTRADTLRCCIESERDEAWTPVCDTGEIDLASDEDSEVDDAWVELTSDARKRLLSRTLEYDGWIIVVDVMRFTGARTTLLHAVRVLCSAHARASPLDYGARSSRSHQRVFDARTSLRPYDTATWNHYVPLPLVAELRADALQLAHLGQGGTWWIGSGERPRCALEAFALGLLATHSAEALETVPALENCGAQFWVQVRPSVGDSSSVAFHFDRDEQLALNFEIYEPPFFSTVTYLSDGGAPTLVLPIQHASCGACADSHFVAEPRGAPIAAAVCSFPHPGKHLLFDGRLLHGCPSALAQPTQRPIGTEPPLRVSLLVNLWLAHRPFLCEPLPVAWLARLTPLGAVDALPPLGTPDEAFAVSSGAGDNAGADSASGVVPSDAGDTPAMLVVVDTPHLRLWSDKPFEALLPPESRCPSSDCSTVLVPGLRCWCHLVRC
jgi:hypothetical protein